MAGPDVSAWSPRPIKADCLADDLCRFVFSVTFSSEGFHDRLEFMDDSGNSIVLGLGATFQNYVVLRADDLKNLHRGVSYKWRVRLYKATDAGEVFIKASEWSADRFVRK